MKEICLLQAELNKEYYICKVEQSGELFEYLTNLGFEKGEKIKLLKYNYFKTTLMVKVMEINYAIDREVAGGIFVCE